jgi:hypothetical protein
MSIEDFGINWIDEHKIVVDFEFDESFFNEHKTGAIPRLVIGDWENGKQ